MLEKAVPYYTFDGKPKCTWLQWDGQHFRHNPQPPPLNRWSPESYLRYCRSAYEFLDEVADTLRLVVDEGSGPRVVATSHAHRRAVAEELWFRDIG